MAETVASSASADKQEPRQEDGHRRREPRWEKEEGPAAEACLLYTSDAADE